MASFNYKIKGKITISQGGGIKINLPLKNMDGTPLLADDLFGKFSIRNIKEMGKLDSEALIYGATPIEYNDDINMNKAIIHLEPEKTKDLVPSKKPYILTFQISSKNQQLSREFYFELSVTPNGIYSIY